MTSSLVIGFGLVALKNVLKAIFDTLLGRDDACSCRTMSIYHVAVAALKDKIIHPVFRPVQSMEHVCLSAIKDQIYS
jgi:hypothetical protein